MVNALFGRLRNCLVVLLASLSLNALAISAPSITSCTRPSSTTVSLSWTAVSGASYYVVRRSYTSSVGSSSSIGTPSGTSYTDSSAGVDTCYYWVEAWDSTGASARSGMATASSGSGGGGSSGGAFSISATKGTSTSGCTITWTAQSGATGYRVVRGTTSNMDNASILVETVTGTSYTDTTGTAGKTYYYWIVAKKSSGYVTSSYATGYKASSSSGGDSGGGGSESGGGDTPPAPSTYTVAFVSNGGTGTMADESFTIGTAKALTSNGFSRTGYTFLGWAKSAAATTATYTNGQSVTNLTTTAGGLVTLYAVWQANSYTVKFNANGGSGTMANESFVYGTAKALTVCTFTRTGYSFVRWSTNAAGTGTTYGDGESVTGVTATAGGTATLYAIWQVNSYTVKFNANGGSGTMANESFVYGTAKALTANAFGRIGYTFLGWATSASATAAAYVDGASVNNLTATSGGTVNLYAVWKRDLEVTAVTARPRYPWNGLVDIDVSFDAKGLCVVAFDVMDTAGNTNLPARTFYLGNPAAGQRTLEVQPGSHRFVWDAFADLGEVALIPFAVTAKVREKRYELNVSGGTGSGSYVQGESVSISASAKTGYTFESWSGTTGDMAQLASASAASTTVSIPAHDLEYTATYTPNAFTVKFNANGGTGSMSYQGFAYDTAQALTANAFTRTGYTFAGWATSASGAKTYNDKQSVKNLTAASDGLVNLYAVWSVNSYKVAFNANGGTGTMANESFIYGEADILTANTFTRTGYTFAGWATAANGSKVYNDMQSVANLTATKDGTVTLYALWTANTYSVKFNANGGTGTMANESFTYATAKALTANAFTRTGYTFAGWATSASGAKTYTDQQSVNNLTATNGGTVNLYAVWTGVPYTVKFSANGGSGTMTNESFVYGTAKALTANAFTRDGFVFSGWATTATGAKTYSDKQSVNNLTSTSGDTITLYAVWTGYPYTVKFNANGGTGTMANQSFTCGVAQALTANAFTRTGYTFAGWATSASGAKAYSDKQSVNNLTTTNGATVNLYAVWTANTYTVKFNANGGTGTMANESFTYDTAKALTANAFTYEDRLFLGWSESASSTTVKYKDQQSVKNLLTSGSKTIYAVWSGECVQLWQGGPYWAKCNIGTSSPQGTGYFFGWGDTAGYKRTGGEYDRWAVEDGVYRYMNVTWAVVGTSYDGSAFKSFSTTDKYGKWKTAEQLKSEGCIDASCNVVAKYDAATAHWGSPWRMPNKEELEALLSKCTVTYTTISGVRGYLITGKGAFSEKSIFLPATGSGTGSYFYNYASTQTHGAYCSATAGEYGGYYYFGFDKSVEPGVTRVSFGQYIQIRPVISYGN